MGRADGAEDGATISELEQLKRCGAAETQLGADQSAADLEQSLGDDDQGASEVDQQSSHRDQMLSDRDQRSSDRDQVTADEHQVLVAEGSLADDAFELERQNRSATTRERESNTVVRADVAAQRLLTGEMRDRGAAARDLNAAERDQTARARDEAARRRDESAAVRERAAFESGDVSAAVLELRSLRLSYAAMRQEAAQHRMAAAADRQAAAIDRAAAAQDRMQAGLDDLTGVFRRGTGELALTNELYRSRRSGQPLVLAIIDVDRLQRVNDTLGHQAGDLLLRDVATAITASMRAYDVIVRWGGDEFLCAISDVTLAVAAERIVDVQNRLHQLRPGACVSAGLAQLDADHRLDAEDDTLHTLVARADLSLYQTKAHRANGNGNGNGNGKSRFGR